MIKGIYITQEAKPETEANNMLSASSEILDFIYEIEYMQGLYANKRYTQAEATRDRLADKLDDLMRLEPISR